MRRLSIIFAFVLLGGLLINSQALAVEENRLTETSQVAALTGDELRQFHVAQMHPQTADPTGERYLNRDQVRELHHLLNQRGYVVSNREKEYIGPETRAAIRSFQEDRGLTVTGRPNEETLRVLVLSTPQHEMFGIAPEFGEDVE